MKLKPCPFCGGVDLDVLDFSPGAAVQCNECKAQGPREDEYGRELDDDDAAEAWNRRPNPKEPRHG